MPEKREQLKCVYVVANLRRGGRQMEVLELEEIDAHRARSRAKDGGPWVSDFVPMALKTGVRKISKYLPKSNELLSRALDLDDRADRGADQEFDLPAGTTIIDEATGTAQSAANPAGSPMDRLKNKIGAAPATTIDVNEAGEHITDEMRREIAEQDRIAAEEAERDRS